MQTRTFDTSNVYVVTKALINTLQDEGYNITEVNDIGFIKAVRKSQISVSLSDAFFSVYTTGGAAHWLQQDALINITVRGRKIQVRLTVQNTTFDRFFCKLDLKNEEDIEFYTKFFNKVSENVSLEQDNI